MTDDISVKTFYDIETYPDYFLIVAQQSDWAYDEFLILRNPNGKELIEFITNRELIGFFNHGFDDIVLSTILNQLQASYTPLNQAINPLWVFKVSQELINNETNKYFAGLNQPTEDVYKYRGWRTNNLNLKGYENALMLPIVESQYPFDKPLVTAYKKKRTDFYCKNDVVATREAYEYEVKVGSVDAVQQLRRYVAAKLEVPEDNLKKSGTNSMMIKLLKNPSYNRKNFFEYIENGQFNYAFSDPKFVEWYEKIIKWADDREKLDEPILEFERNGVTYKFALGGGHGHNLMTMFKNVFGLDFASLYPWILINICGLGEHCTSLFREIVETRVAAKKSNKKLAEGLKLAINSLYGLTRSFNNGAQLYNKYLGLDICIAGQVILYDLALRLEDAGATLVNINTDGVLYTPNGNDEVINILADEFSKRINIGIDLEDYPYYFAEHVNSYFVFNEAGELIKKKGTFNDAKPYSNNLATPHYVMNYFTSLVFDEEQPTWEDMFKTEKNSFILRAKNTSNFEFFFGLSHEYERYSEKTGKKLKYNGVEFYPLQSYGKQFRGFATKTGYDLRNYNHKTGKYVESGVLKTGKHRSKYKPVVDSFDEINVEYYSGQAEAIIKQISSNLVSKN